MKNFQRILLVAAVALAAVGSIASVASAAPNPISISQCVPGKPALMSKNVGPFHISWTNVSSHVAKEVIFAVSWQTYTRRATDIGQQGFAPNQLIEHTYDIFSDVKYYAGTHATCKAVKVVFVNGTTWTP